MNRERLWTKDFISVMLTNFLLTLFMYLLLVTIPSYAVTQFQASTSTAGLVSGIFIIGALIGRLLIGRKIGDFGSKKILVTGLLLYVITSALYLGAFNLPLLLIIRILHGFAYGIASTAVGTIMAQNLPHSRRGEGVGYYGMSMTLATAVGPFLGIYLNQHADFKIIFILTTILAVINFIISFIVREPVYTSSANDVTENVKGFQISNYLEFKSIPISVITMIIGFSYSGILVFLSFYSRQINLVEAASFFFIVHSVTVLATRPFSGRLFDIKGANFIIYPCIVIYTIGMIILSQAGSGLTLLSAGVIIALGYGNFLSSAQTVAIKGISPHRLGLATATFYILWDLGVGIGPYILGFLVPVTGYRGLYLILSLVILSTLVLYYLLIGKKLPVKQSTSW